jgi:hypothetical protein
VLGGISSTLVETVALWQEIEKGIKKVVRAVSLPADAVTLLPG